MGYTIENMEETYRPVYGYEGLYEVSDKGNVKAKEKKIGSRIYPEKVMCLERTYHGYARVMLTKKGVPQKIYVHRMVASAFLERPEVGEQVNHKNLVKHDNRVENLEWVTQDENIAHYYSKKGATL